MVDEDIEVHWMVEHKLETERLVAAGGWMVIGGSLGELGSNHHCLCHRLHATAECAVGFQEVAWSSQEPEMMRL